MKTEIIRIKNKNYSNLLKQIYKAPEKLYCQGNTELLNKTCISIVGTRKYSEYGDYISKELIAGLANLDIVIVSGLAQGIDTIAHQQSLKHSIPTIAVLGSGIDNIYPRSNFNLAQKIIDQSGLIISEHPAKTPPINFHFPQRNRIISGLSIATIVIECAAKSGALITARFALEQGRDIFTIPGDIDRPTSQGPLQLLQNGSAYPISGAKDLIEALQKQPNLFPLDLNKTLTPTETPKIKLKLPPEQEKALSTLTKTRSKTLEQIQEKTKFPTEKILEIITILEISGLIKNKNGKYLRTC
jgi:DNA processing protein